MRYTEVIINRDHKAQLAHTGPITWSRSVKDLFTLMQREYGRCTSKIYLDTPEGVKAVGWIFEKKERYNPNTDYLDTARYFTQEVWVELFEDPKHIYLDDK